MIEHMPHDDNCGCEDCDAYWTAYEREEDDAIDRNRNWRDYV